MIPAFLSTYKIVLTMLSSIVCNAYMLLNLTLNVKILCNKVKLYFLLNARELQQTQMVQQNGGIMFNWEMISFPKCECFDFECHHLPCKHLFAIFLMIPGYSWESLPDYFRNSPFITIDNFIISPCKRVQLNKSENVNESMNNCTGDGYLNKDRDANEVVDTQPSWTNDDKGDAQCLDSIPNSCTETNSSISTEQGQLGSITVISQKLRSNLKLLIDYSYTCKKYSSLMG